MPSPLSTSDPLAGAEVITMELKSSALSASESLPATLMMTLLPSSTVALSSTATGASLTGLTVRVTLATLEVAPLTSSIV